MNINNKVSVIMSFYNEKSEWIIQAIDSIINQSYKNLEIIFVNDNPKNIQLKDILNKYKETDSRITVIENDVNIGLIGSLNKALKIAKGEFIARADADDICCIERIEKQVKYLLKNEDIYLVCSDIEYIDENNKILNKNGVCLEKFEDIKIRLRYYNCFNHPTWMVRRSVLDELHGYRNVKSAEDYDFVCRLVLKGYRCENIKEKLVKYRIRPSSISNSNKLLQIKTTYLVAKYYKNKKLLNDDILSPIRLTDVEQRKFEKYWEILSLCKFKKRRTPFLIISLLYMYLTDNNVKNDINVRLLSRVSKLNQYREVFSDKLFRRG